MKTPEGLVSRAYAFTLCPAGTRVTVPSHGWDKYGGRLTAPSRSPAARTSPAS